jgi:hypothetical protein
MPNDENSTPQTPTPEPVIPAPVSNQPLNPQPATGAPAPAPTNGLAIAALIVGIIAFVSGWAPIWGILVGATAVVLGILGLKKPGGKAMSIIGIVGGGLSALWSLITTVFFVIALVAGTSAIGQAAESYEQQTKDQQSVLDGKKDYAKGETARFGNFDVKVNSVTRNYVSSNQYNTPDEGNEFVVVNITVTNKSETEDRFRDFNLSLNEAGKATGSTYITNLEDEFKNGNVAPNDSVTGNVAYEVTKDATDLKLQYTITMIGGAQSGEKVVYTLAL